MAAKVFQKCSLCFATFRQLRLIQPVSARYIHSSNNDVQSADIVISGGGMVGATLACALGHESLLKNKRIILLETGNRKKFELKETYGNRTCTLSPATIDLFDRIGAWDEIKGMRCHEVLRMQVWESCSNSLITFNQKDLADELAYVAENDIILEAVTRSLEALGGNVEVMYKTAADSYDIAGVNNSQQSNSWVNVNLNNGQTIQTKLLNKAGRRRDVLCLSSAQKLEKTLPANASQNAFADQVGSDGMNSLVRKTANFHTVSFNYDQRAVVAVLTMPECTNNVAWQRFLPTGPIAMLPLSDSAMSLIWTTSQEEAKDLQALSEDNFVDAVNDAFFHDRDISDVAETATNTFQNLLMAVAPGSASMRQLPPTVTGVQANSRASFPLGLTHSSNYVRHRVAIVGDAAHRFHPLAGQGVNLGFGDVAKLTEVITKAAYDGSDLGSLTYLKEYETSRQRKVLPVMATVDGLQRLYNTDFTPMVLIRSLGLQATNAISPLKNWIMKEASR